MTRAELMNALEFETNPDYNMLLDIQHCYSINSDLQLVRDFWEDFQDKIVEIHISGQTDIPGQHMPLFESNQAEIIKSLPQTNIPIICESPLQRSEDIFLERDFIVENYGE